MDVPEGHPFSAGPNAFLEGVRPQIHRNLVEEVLALNGVKFQLALKVQLRKDNTNGSEKYTDPVLRHKREAILQVVEIDKAFPTVQETLEKWTQRGSGSVVDKVMTLWLDIARYQHLTGGSYIPLPAEVAKKNRGGIAVLNVKNNDENCLIWSLLSVMFPVVKDSQRPTKYTVEHGLDFTGKDAPTLISQIPRVEKQLSHYCLRLGQRCHRTPPEQSARVHSEDQPASVTR